MDTNVLHCVHGHSNEPLLRETSKSPDVELLGTPRPCTGCSIAKGYGKPILSSTKSRASEKLGRSIFVDVSDPMETPPLLSKRYIMLVKYGFSRSAWVYILKQKSEAADVFRKCLADVRADGVLSKVGIVRSDNGGCFYGGRLERCADSIESSRILRTPTAQNRMVCRESARHH